MSAASIIAIVCGVLGAAGSIAAVLVGLGRVLAGLDSLREESRKRGDDHAQRIEALRTDLATTTTTMTVGQTKVAVLESEVNRLRSTVHEHANYLQKLLAKVTD